MLWKLGKQLKGSPSSRHRLHKFNYPIYSEQRKDAHRKLDSANGNIPKLVGENVGSILAEVDGSMGSMRLEDGEGNASEVGLSVYEGIKRVCGWRNGANQSPFNSNQISNLFNSNRNPMRPFLCLIVTR